MYQLFCTRSCSAVLHIRMYIPVVTWLPAHWPCMCTYHIVQHESEDASIDAVNGCDHLTTSSIYAYMLIYIRSHWSYVVTSCMPT